MDISVKDYLLTQPGFPRVSPTDPYYLEVAVALSHAWQAWGGLGELSEAVRRQVVLATVCYFQDIVADAGLWRTFTRLHNERHGQPLPHYGRSDDYIDYELNVDDLRYLIWYIIAGEHAPEPGLEPDDADIARLAEVLHAVLDERYTEAPVAPDWQMLSAVDIDNPAEAQEAYRLAYWMFWRSYLMRPTSLAATRHAMPEAQAIIARYAGEDASPALADLNDTLMVSRPAGPLSLTIGQWIEEIIR
ncbi:MAG: DUF3843 family protein [Muribaculaceae bacterium]|nr:DUF3843 family protein [Muribaculaceae bacterium]